jgi:hypothetical protein
MLALNLGRTTWNLFEVWPKSEEVQFVWQADFTDIATFLDQSPAAGPVSIGGWTPETMDPPTMELLLKREDLSLRYFDPTQSIILPVNPAGELIHLFWPAPLPLASELEQKLLSWGAATTTTDAFVVTPFSNSSLPPIQFPAEVNFSEELLFLGYDLVQPVEISSPGTLRLLTFWRVERPTSEPRRFFLHLVDDQERPIVQQDTLGAPADYWQAGDLIIQLHSLEIPVIDGPTSLLLGIYNPVNNQRLITAENADAIRLPIP